MCEHFMNPDFLRRFIERYRSFPCLWQVKSPDYNNRHEKFAAYKNLAEMCKSAYPQANIDFVRNRIKNLRTVFQKEHKKVSMSKKYGKMVYKPRLWYFDLLRFIVEQKSPKKSTNTIKGEMLEIENEEEMTDVPATSEPQSLLVEVSNSLNTPPTEISRKSSNHLDRNTTTEKSTFSRRRSEDEFDAFGFTVAAKMRRMDENQSLLAELLINQVLYKGMKHALSEQTSISDYFINCSEFNDTIVNRNPINPSKTSSSTSILN